MKKSRAHQVTLISVSLAQACLTLLGEAGKEVDMKKSPTVEEKGEKDPVGRMMIRTLLYKVRAEITKQTIILYNY